MAKYRTDEQMLVFLSTRIERLEKTLERLETLGMTSVASGGNTKSFRNAEDIKLELDRAEREFNIIQARVEGNPINPHFKEMVVCNRRQY